MNNKRETVPQIENKLMVAKGEGGGEYELKKKQKNST